jgi:hypothetical protein
LIRPWLSQPEAWSTSSLYSVTIICGDFFFFFFKQVHTIRGEEIRVGTPLYDTWSSIDWANLKIDIHRNDEQQCCQIYEFRWLLIRLSGKSFFANLTTNSTPKYLIKLNAVLTLFNFRSNFPELFYFILFFLGGVGGEIFQWNGKVIHI